MVDSASGLVLRQTIWMRLGRRRGEEGRDEGKAGSKQRKWRKKGVGMWREDGGMEVWVDGWSE